MTEENQNYKTQIEDFRNLKPYYDLVFEIMSSCSRTSFERNMIELTRMLREFIINTAPYIKEPEKRLEEIEGKFSDVLKHKKLNPTTQQEIQFEKAQDEYFNYIQKLRISMIIELERSGFMPKMDKVRQKQQSEKTRGASI